MISAIVNLKILKSVQSTRKNVGKFEVANVLDVAGKDTGQETALRKKISMEKIGIDFKNNYKCLDVGCGNNDFALSLEEISNFEIDHIDVDSKILLNKTKSSL